MDVITTHVNSDFDCLGAMIAAKRLYPDAEMVFAGAQERGLRQFFLKSAFYAHDFKRVRDLDLEKVTRLILVDVQQADRIGPFAEVARRPGVEIHIYDHHPGSSSDLHGAVEVIEPVGATVTVFSQIFMERGIALGPHEATMMMLGLYEDTGSLLFNSTTERDYQAAAYLLGQGADLNTVSDFLHQDLVPEQVTLLNDLLASCTVLNANGIDVGLAHASSGGFVADLAVLANKLMNMKGYDALVVAVRMGDRVFMVGRSRIPEVPVGEILAEFGGGGHGFAASGTVRKLTLVQVLERLPEVLRRRVNPVWEARHLMSFPVKSVQAQASIMEVRQLLTRYSLNAMPVLEGEVVVGIITRQVAERAAHHRLTEVAVREYMSSEFETVSPETPIDDLKSLIVGRNQRFVPVLDGEVLVGAITRTDLLRHVVTGVRAAHLPGWPVEAIGGGLKQRQVVRRIREQLPQRVGELLGDLGAIGDTLSLRVYAVGGFVRDLLLGRENLDVDVVVEGDGIAFAEAFARRHDCRVRAHRKFGTAVLVFSDEFKIDVASARMEYYLEPGALPTVEDAPLKIDLYRRDFTINTLAVALNRGEFGRLVDYYGAQRDLRDQVLRVLHNLSFVEDPTRVFRAIRFEQRLGLQMGPHTEQLLHSAVRMGFVDRVGGTRLFNELTIILKEADPFPAIARMAELKLLQYIHPAVELRGDGQRVFAAAGKAIHWYELLYTGEQVRGWLVYLLCLVARLSKEQMAELCRRVAVPSRFRGALVEQWPEARRVLSVLERGKRGKDLRSSDLYHWLEPFAPEVLLALLASTRHEHVRREISRYFTRLREVRPLLTGEDLKALGVPPGPTFRTILRTLLDARLNGRVLTRENEVALVRKRFLESTQNNGNGGRGR